MRASNTRIIGLDPGNESTGMVVMDDGIIIGAYNLPNTALFSKITAFSLHKSLTIVIEDIKPFSVKLSPQVVDTCKFIGMLVYRLEVEAGLKVALLSRYDVKRWVFDRYNAIAGPIVEQKIIKATFAACDVATQEEIRVNQNGRRQKKGSFIYVDDKVVQEAMRIAYQVKLLGPGKGYQYGLQSHSWQALAVATCYLMTKQ